ncbi:MAG TPA: hypothetical protein DIT54_08750 [Lachnospiraceae bacterium]|nr:hypothetical protein [Lachnospiraceae bacterium]
MKKDSRENFQQQRHSYAFLMEMLWVCGFFVICVGVFALLFVKADQISTNAEDLSYAIALSQNKIETAFTELKHPTGNEIEYYNSNWQPTTKDDDDRYATVTTTYSKDQDILTVSVVITQIGETEPIYELTGSHYLPDQR